MNRFSLVALCFIAVLGTASIGMADETGPKHVRVRVTCFGDRVQGAKVTLKWGHHEKDDNQYLNLEATPATTKEGAFEMPDSESEFEIQSEGGHATGYIIEIFFKDKEVIHLVYNKAGAIDFKNLGGVNVKRSSPVNGYGEQNISVFTNRLENPGTIE